MELGTYLAVLAAAVLQGPTTIRYPAEDLGVSTLAARAKVQRDTVNQFKVFYQFQFHDRLPESGITFFNHVVDDAARFHKPVHYDHGTGIDRKSTRLNSSH